MYTSIWLIFVTELAKSLTMKKDFVFFVCFVVNLDD